MKRCFDRVVLKNSRIAYSGIYSDSESDEFLKRTDESESVPAEKPKEAPKKTTTKATPKKEQPKGGDLPVQENQIEIIKKASSLIKRKENQKVEAPVETPQDDDNYLD